MPKLRENLNVLKFQTKDPKAKVGAVVSSLVIAYVFTKYNVFPKSEDCEILLKCLRLPTDETVCFEFMKSVNEFDKILRYRLMILCILLKHMQSKTWTGNAS